MKSYYYIRIISYKDGDSKTFFVSGAAQKRLFTRGPGANFILDLRIPKFLWNYFNEIYMRRERREYRNKARMYKAPRI